MKGNLLHVTRLDTIKMGAEQSCIVSIKEGALQDPVRKMSGGKIIRHDQYVRELFLPIGVKSIMLDELNGNVIIELSAKILGEKYPELINKNNSEEVLDNLSCEAVEFNTKVLLESAWCGRVDIVDDLKVQGQAADYFDALYICGSSNKYAVSLFPKESILFQNKSKSVNESIIFYDKHVQVQRDPNSHLIDPEVFKSVLRVEQRISRFAKIRDTFRLPKHNPPMLTDILESSYLHNLEMLQKLKLVTPESMQLYPEGMRFDQIVKMKGMEQILTELNFDMNKTKMYIERHVRGNINSYLTKYRALRTSMLSESTGIEPKHLISEIEELLQAA